MTKKQFLRFFLLLPTMIWLFSMCAPKPDELHERILTVDTHVDTPVSRTNGFHITKMNDRDKGGGQVDFPRMKQGGLDAICYAVFLSQGKRTAEDFKKSTAKAEKDYLA